MGARPDGWWRDRRAAMGRLVAALAAHARSTGDGVAVVFDGRRLQVGDPGPVEVSFAARAGRNAADHEIAARVTADPDPASLTVVTSDADLARRARAAGARVEGAGAFRRRVEESGNPC
jgi:predicted RNA-binding protein with PIN domain